MRSSLAVALLLAATVAAQDNYDQTDVEDFPENGVQALPPNTLIMKRSEEFDEMPDTESDLDKLLDENDVDVYSEHSMGKRSMALGRMGFRPGKRSLALGRHAYRPGKRSMALGRMGFRPGKRSMALGRMGFRPGKRSMALGRHAFRPGKRSLALGRGHFRPGKRSEQVNYSESLPVYILPGEEYLSAHIFP